MHDQHHSLLIRGDGVWQGEDGSRFVLNLDLEARGRCCEGVIHWRAADTIQPDDAGTEFVRGRFDPDTGELDLYGYRLDNPALLSLDEYRVYLSPDGDFEGTSRGPWGTWRNVLGGRLQAG